jgi:hypothetical protein
MVTESSQIRKKEGFMDMRENGELEYFGLDPSLRKASVQDDKKEIMLSC